MRIPFFRKEPKEYIPEGRKPRKRETLKEVSEKILIRKMKKNPDGFGIEAAERVLNLDREQPATLKNQLKEMRELQSLLADLAPEAPPPSSIWEKLLNPTTIGALVDMVKSTAQPQQYVPIDTAPNGQHGLASTPMAEIPHGGAKQIEQATPKLSDLIFLLEKEPAEVITTLKHSAQGQLWVKLLAGQTYESVIALLQPYQNHEQVGQYVQELLSPGKKSWIETLISEAKSAVDEVKSLISQEKS